MRQSNLGRILNIRTISAVLHKEVAGRKIFMIRNNLIRARREAGLSQIELAKKLQVRQATVSSWETGQSDPDPIQVPRIRDILDNTDPHLFDIDDVPVSVKDFLEMLR